MNSALSATKESYGMLSPLAVFSSFLPSCKMLSSAAWSSNSNWDDLAVELINCCQTLRQILNRLVVWFHAKLKHGLENQLNQHNQNHHFFDKGGDLGNWVALACFQKHGKPRKVKHKLDQSANPCLNGQTYFAPKTESIIIPYNSLVAFLTFCESILQSME